MKDKIEITENAQNHIAKVISQDKVNYFRISVKGGGCAGFQYIWGITSEIDDTPHLIDDILVLDPLAEMYVIGSEIDYVTELGGSFLKVVNPTSTSSCGCGESFGV